jgi:hypothetical protein
LRLRGRLWAEALDQREQVGDIEGLGEVSGDVERRSPGRWIRHRSEDDNRNIRLGALQLANHLFPPEARQRQIEKNEVGRVLTNDIERLLSGMGENGGMTFVSKKLADDVDDPGVVVDDQNTAWSHRILSSRITWRHQR